MNESVWGMHGQCSPGVGQGGPLLWWTELCIKHIQMEWRKEAAVACDQWDCINTCPTLTNGSFIDTHWNRWVTHWRLSGDWGYLAVRGNSPCMDKGLAWIKTNTSAAVAPDQSEWVWNKWGGVVTVFTRHRYSMTGSVCITMSCCARKQALYRVCSVRVEKWRTSSMVPFPLALSPSLPYPPPPPPSSIPMAQSDVDFNVCCRTTASTESLHQLSRQINGLLAEVRHQ